VNPVVDREREVGVEQVHGVLAVIAPASALLATESATGRTARALATDIARSRRRRRE
jgi:hypothetical protein